MENVPLDRKLNLKPGEKLRVVGKPAGVTIPSSGTADGVLVFVIKLAELERKAGQLGTDLNRDIVWKHMLKHGVQAVRQIAIDEVWSALRFRPAK